MITKRLANPRGLANVSFASVGMTASPVIEGLETARTRRRIAETMFAINNGVFMFI